MDSTTPKTQNHPLTEADRQAIVDALAAFGDVLDELVFRTRLEAHRLHLDLEARSPRTDERQR